MTTIFQTTEGKILKTFSTSGSGSTFAVGDTVDLNGVYAVAGKYTVDHITHQPMLRSRIIHLKHK